MYRTLSYRIVNMEKRHRYIAAIVIIAIVAFMWFSSAFGVTTCFDEACFLGQANACGQAVYTNQISTVTVLYQTKDCILNKTIIGMDGEEPPSVKDDFMGKSMACMYLRNDFNPLFLSRISYGTESQCQGELRDTILLYQYY